jgi:hypothetical protein
MALPAGDHPWPLNDHLYIFFFIHSTKLTKLFRMSTPTKMGPEECAGTTKNEILDDLKTTLATALLLSARLDAAKKKATIPPACFEFSAGTAGVHIQNFLDNNPDGLAIVVLREGDDPHVTCTQRQWLEVDDYNGPGCKIATRVGIFWIRDEDRDAILHAGCRMILLYPDANANGYANVYCQKGERQAYQQILSWDPTNSVKAGLRSTLAALFAI